MPYEMEYRYSEHFRMRVISVALTRRNIPLRARQEPDSNSSQLKYPFQCSADDQQLCARRHIAGLEQGSILANDALNALESAAGPEHQFCKGALVVSWGFRFPFP